MDIYHGREANNLFKVYLVKERVLRANHNVELRLEALNTSIQRQKELRELVHIKKEYFNHANDVVDDDKKKYWMLIELMKL